MTKKIILYARESTLKQVQDGYNLEDQKKRMLAFIDTYFEKNNYEIEIYEEKGKSAKNLKRPMMEKLLDDIAYNRVNYIVVYCIDRLTRSISDLADLVTTLDKKKITLLSVTEKIDTSNPQGRFFLHLLGCMAQLERENISERVQRALLESATQGNYAKSVCPFGYKKNKDKKLVPDEEKAKLVVWIFEQIARNKKTPVEVSKELQKTKPFNRCWYESRIYAIIRNKIYIGTYTVQDVEIENHTTPLVDKELWLQANELLCKQRKYNTHDYTYKRMVYCKKCKCMVGGASGYGKQKKVYLYYKCKCCKQYVPETYIDEQVDKSISNKMRYEMFQKRMSEILKECEADERQTLKDMTMMYLLEDIQMEKLNLKEELRLTDHTWLSLCILKTELLKSRYILLDKKSRGRIVKKYINMIYVGKNKTIEIEWLKSK